MTRPFDALAWTKPASWRSFARCLRGDLVPGITDAIRALQIDVVVQRATMLGERPAPSGTFTVVGGGERSADRYILCVCSGDCPIFREEVEMWALGMAMAAEMGAPFQGCVFEYLACEHAARSAFLILAGLLFVPEELPYDHDGAHVASVSAAAVSCLLELRSEPVSRHAACLEDFVYRMNAGAFGSVLFDARESGAMRGA
jgi:hypothetical protein